MCYIMVAFAMYFQLPSVISKGIQRLSVPLRYRFKLSNILWAPFCPHNSTKFCPKRCQCLSFQL